MGKLNKLLFLLAFVSCASIAYEPFTRYMGFDAQIRRMNFRGGYGDNLLHSNLFQRNPYVGVKFNDHLSLEIGYGSTVLRSRTATLTTGDVCGGVRILSTLSPISFKSTLKIHYPHASFLIFYPLPEGVPVHFFGAFGIGMSFIKGEVIRKTISLANHPVYRVKTFSSNKNILRVGGGVQCMFTSNLGLRGTVFLENTHRFIMTSSDDTFTLFTHMIKTRKTILYGLGIFVGW